MRLRTDPFAYWTFCLIIAAGFLLSGQPANAVVYQWNGSQSSDWQNLANWNGGVVPDYDGPPSGTTWGHRLEVNQGATKAELVYDGSLGTTVYASPSESPNHGRGLIMGNGATGAMRITGGTFSTSGSTSSDLVGHQSSGAGTLTIAGGNYISSNTGLYLGTGGGGTATLTIDSGTATITTLRMNATTATVNLNGGTLQANIIDVRDGTNTLNFNGGTLQARRDEAGFLEGLDAANVLSAGAVIDTNGFNITITQALLDGGGDGGLTKRGDGALTLSGENTYTGVTTVSQGTLKLGNDSALGTTAGKTVVESGATVDIAGFKAGTGTPSGEWIEVSGGGVGGAGALINSGATQTQAFRNITLLGDTTLGGTGRWDLRDGTFAVGGNKITKVGGNNVSIVRATVTEPGDVDVIGGTFRIEGSTNWNAATPVTIRVAGGTRLDYWGTTIAHNQNIEVTGGMVSANSTSSPSLSGTLTLNAGNNTIGVGNEWGSPTLTITARVTGDGGFALNGWNVYGGSGILVLANPDNDYAGDTAVNTGTLRLGASGVIPDGSGKGNLVLNAGSTAAGTFDLNGFDETVNGLHGTSGAVLGQVVNDAVGTASVLTVGGGNATSTFAGVLRDNTGTGGTLALTKIGTGTLTLSGENTYTGETTVSGGALRIANEAALGMGETTVEQGAQLELSGGVTVSGQTIHIARYGTSGAYGALRSLDGYNVWDGPVYFDGSDSRVGAVNSGSVLEISGEIRDGTNNNVVTVRNNLGKTIFSGANSYTGETRIYNGTLELGAHDSLPAGNPLLLGIGSLHPTFDLKGFNQTIGSLRSEGDGTHTITNTGNSESTLTVTQNSDKVFGGTITNGDNALHLIKSGSSQLTLSGANTYTGLTTVNAGTLLVTGSLGNNGSSHVQIASAGTAFGSADPTIVRRIAAGDSFASLGSRIAGSGTFGTQADLMAGSNGSGSSLDMAMAWRTFDSAETAAFPALTNPLSDVVQLTGMGTGETDPFVLQMSYNSSLVQPYHDGMFLAWLSPTDGWTNAVEGNIGSGASAVAGATGSWDSIVDAGELASYLGSWGIDSTGGTAWAVLNHNSQFAIMAVPEPSALLLGCMGLLGLLLTVRRRR